MLRGTHDLYLLKDGFLGHEAYLAHGEHLELDGCSHWLQNDCASSVNHELDRFLDKLETR